MRLNIVFFTAILALVASVDPASAASDATVMKLPMVMNSADAHEVMGNDHRLLRTHKTANTEEERGFADVVIEAMAKLKAEKLYSEIMKTKLVAVLDDVWDMKVLDKLDEMIQLETFWRPYFKRIYDEYGDPVKTYSTI
ncbi:unnamed protein product [Phytophthora lilii]|uniref:RxLR effector protein n=1 Tax=Phytophthora lilii TaxID=2077276 RepID=A0A9W7CGK5_9STRA|nr:unnamed protein product [Phytophthora lilii]